MFNELKNVLFVEGLIALCTLTSCGLVSGKRKYFTAWACCFWSSALRLKSLPPSSGSQRNINKVWQANDQTRFLLGVFFCLSDKASLYFLPLLRRPSHLSHCVLGIFSFIIENGMFYQWQNKCLCATLPLKTKSWRRPEEYILPQDKLSNG